MAISTTLFLPSEDTIPSKICIAFNLLVANDFLLYADRDVFDEKVGEEKFTEGLAWYESGPLHVVGPHFVADDQADVALLPKPAFEFDAPQFLSQETASSFAKYCRSVGAMTPHYWQKIYTRLGLEYTSTSPPRQDEELLAVPNGTQCCGVLLFLPAGCVGCVLAILFVRYLYSFYGEGWFGEDAFLAEYAVRVAEPIGFLAAALWVLPRFHRTFIVLFAVPYCTFEMLFIVMKITCSDSPWRDASLATTSLVFCVCAAICCIRSYTRDREGKP